MFISLPYLFNNTYYFDLIYLSYIVTLFIVQPKPDYTKSIDDRSDDILINDENVGEDSMNMLDDEANEDTHISDEVNCESTEHALASSDNIDDRTDEYDYSDSFIDDDTLDSDGTQYDSGACNADDWIFMISFTEYCI